MSEEVLAPRKMAVVPQAGKSQEELMGEILKSGEGAWPQFKKGYFHITKLFS